jgi:hypothetical protein
MAAIHKENEKCAEIGLKIMQAEYYYLHNLKNCEMPINEAYKFRAKEVLLEGKI